MINNPGPTLFSVVPTGSPTKATLLPAGAIPGLVVGPLSTIYVEPPAPVGRGDDATAQRGNAALPCATLDKALALAVAALPAFSAIELAAGTYAPPSAPVSPLLEDGVIQSSGNPADVVIDALGTGLPCFDLSSPAHRGVWTLGAGTTPAFRCRADPGVPAIKADGTAAPAGTFFDGAFALSAVIESSGGIELRCVGAAILSNLEDFNADPIIFDRCGQVFFLGTCLFIGGAPCTMTVDYNDPLQPTGGSGQLLFLGSMLWPSGSITLAAQAGMRAQAGNVLPLIQGSALTVGPGPGFAKTSIQIPQGVQLLGGLDFESAGREFPDSASGAPPVISIAGELAAHAGFKVAAPAANQITVNCNGAIVRTDVQAGDGVLATFRGAAFDSGPSNGGISTVGTGACQPPDGAPIGATAAVAPITTIALPFRISGAYHVIPVADDPTCWPTAVNGYTATQCDVHVAIGAGFVNGSIFML